MITPELVGYIRGEFAKGKTRDEIHRELVSQGGWSETDLNEAFRMVIPMQDFAESHPGNQGSAAVLKSAPLKLSKKSLSILALIIVGLLCVLAWYFYRAQIVDFWNSSMDKVSGLYSSFSSPDATTPEPEPEPVIAVKDCGTSTAPDLKTPSTYQNNAVLNCLGSEALLCTGGARATLRDDLFPTVFQIVKNTDKTCNFRLSYGADSTLVDITGRKLALQYMACPVSIVKSVDETGATPSFNAPSINEPGKFASEIYFYGTLGLFMEKNVDRNKITQAGCGGPYIDSMIASYRSMQSGN